MSCLDSGNNTGVVMNKLLVTTIGLAALVATPALSADMPLKAPPPPVPLWSWSGCYIGGNVGVGWRRTEWTTSFPAPVAAAVGVTRDWDESRGVGGGQAGCNYQFGAWMLGFELDATAARFGESQILVPGALLGFGNPTALLTTNGNSIYSASGRLGYAWDRWLWYVKGGYAYTTTDFTVQSVPAVGAAVLIGSAQSTRMDGFVAGVGLEYALTDRLIAGFEYDYYGFRGGDRTVQNNVLLGNNIVNFTGIRHDVQTVTARLSYFIPTWVAAPPPAPIYSK